MTPDSLFILSVTPSLECQLLYTASSRRNAIIIRAEDRHILLCVVYIYIYTHTYIYIYIYMSLSSTTSICVILHHGCLVKYRKIVVRSKLSIFFPWNAPNQYPFYFVRPSSLFYYENCLQLFTVQKSLEQACKYWSQFLEQNFKRWEMKAEPVSIMVLSLYYCFQTLLVSDC